MAYKGAYREQDEKYLKELVLGCITDEPTRLSSTKIADYLGLNARDVRLLIQKLRNDGYPICATPEQGYWIARTSLDMDDTMKIQHLQKDQFQKTGLFLSNPNLCQQQNSQSMPTSRPRIP